MCVREGGGGREGEKAFSAKSDTVHTCTYILSVGKLQ